MSHRLLFFGSSGFGLPALAALKKNSDLEVIGVVTQPAKPVGRHQTLTPTPIATWAATHGVPIFDPPTLKAEDAQARIRAFEADTFLVAAYGLILRTAVLQMPANGCLNIHGSLLPKFRGASPISAAILAGETQTGITYMLMDEGIDTGAMIQQHAIDIHPLDTTPILEQKLADLAGTTVVRMLNDWWAKKLVPVPQPATGATYASKLTKTDGRASWESGELLVRKLRAFTPWPGLWAEWQSAPVKFLEATFAPGPVTAAPGQVAELPERRGWGIACQDGYFIPHLVHFSGRKPQPAKAIPGSYPGFIGSQFD